MNFEKQAVTKPQPLSVYALLPYAVFAFFALCFVLHPFSPLTTHHLADPDDYMRLNEVISWLNGQGWYDLSVPRLSPGAHTVVHWSRLVDLPIALTALPFIHSFGITNAALIASLIVPLLWFAVLLVLLVALARPLPGRECATLSCILVLFAPVLLFNYTPGRVDHHGIQAIIAGFGLMCLHNILLDRRGKKYSVLAALAFACGFWIGAEALLWAIIFMCCLSIAAAWQAKNVARHAAIFGACLFLFTGALIPIALPASEFSSRALSWFSPAYALFAALSGGMLALGWAVGLRVDRKFMRLGLYAFLSAAATVAFFAIIPSALRGPFTDYDVFDATIALDNITEARPLYLSLQFNRWNLLSLVPAVVSFGRLLLLPLTAFVVCLWQARRAKDRLRLVWLTQGVFLLTAITLSLFWQMRVAVFMELFMLTPLAVLLGAGWDKLGERLSHRPLFWAEIALFLAFGPLTVVLIPSLLTNKPLYPDIALFPVARAAAACPLEPVLAALNDPLALGAKPLTIMNGSDTGPQILFATQHSVIAGNFDVQGNRDAYAFFHATQDAEALAAAATWKADIVLLCRTAPMLYLGKDYYALSHLHLQPGKDGLLRFTNTDAQQPLIQRLILGKIPTWLKPIEIPGSTDYLVFTIHYPTGHT